MTRLWLVSLVTLMRQTVVERWGLPGQVMLGQQSRPQCGQNKGACCGLLKNAHPPCSSEHHRSHHGEGAQHHVPGSACHCGLQLLFITGQESSPASLLPPQVERSQSPSPRHVLVLQGTVATICSSCITVWYGACTASY